MTGRMGDAAAHIKVPLQKNFVVHIPMLPWLMQDGGTDPEQYEVDAREAVLDAFAYVRSGALHTACCVDMICGAYILQRRMQTCSPMDAQRLLCLMLFHVYKSGIAMHTLADSTAGRAWMAACSCLR